MSIKQRPFVMMPYFLDLTNQNLKYLDVLTYVAVKSFDNAKNNCFPSYEAIAERSGLSRSFIIESINRLQASKYLSVYKREGYRAPNKSFPNQYSFMIDAKDYYFMIPYEIFNLLDLTNYERAMLLLLRQFSVTLVELYGSINEFADCLGLTKQTIYKQYLSLVAKGYLDKVRLKSKITKLLKIDWNYANHLVLDKQYNLNLMIA
jgi:biotin operon repressor